MAKQNLNKLTVPELECLLAGICSGVVLVGGQALAFWADYYQVDASSSGAILTHDLDLFGNKDQAQKHIDVLISSFSGKLKFKLAGLDTPPPSSAVILIDSYHQDGASLCIDYIITLAGYDYASERKILDRSLDVEIGKAHLRCMHPLDCLKSRIFNLAIIPSKRNELGVKQCEVAVDVVHHFLAENVMSIKQTRTSGFSIAEEIANFAVNPHALAVYRDYGVNILRAIDPAQLGEKFQTIRWPQIIQRVSAKRSSFIGVGSGIKKLNP